VKPRFVLEDGELKLVPVPFATRVELVHAIEDGSVLERLGEHEFWKDRPRLGVLAISGIARLVGGWRAYTARDVRRMWGDPDGEPYRLTLALLTAFRDEALASGADHAPVLVFPREKDLEGLALHGDRYWTGLLTELEQRGVETLDVADALSEAWMLAHEDPDRPRIYRGGHLSPAGNALVAAAVREWLVARLR
jgi:hypothetical protein